MVDQVSDTCSWLLWVVSCVGRLLQWMQGGSRCLSQMDLKLSLASVPVQFRLTLAFPCLGHFLSPLHLVSTTC